MRSWDNWRRPALRHCLKPAPPGPNVRLEPFDKSQAVEAEIVTPGRLSRFTTQALANSLWAYATLRFYPTRFLEASLLEVGPAPRALGPQNPEPQNRAPVCCDAVPLQ